MAEKTKDFYTSSVVD